MSSHKMKLIDAHDHKYNKEKEALRAVFYSIEINFSSSYTPKLEGSRQFIIVRSLHLEQYKCRYILT